MKESQEKCAKAPIRRGNLAGKRVLWEQSARGGADNPVQDMLSANNMCRIPDTGCRRLLLHMD